MKDLASISEIFFSIQGEGTLVGIPFVFVRFSCCNLKCSYCDTKWNWKKSDYCIINEKERIENPIDTETLKEILKNFDFTYLTFTGGEPLLYASFIEAFLPYDKKILIETNGTLPESLSERLLERIDFWSVDIKLPSLASEDYFDIHSAFIDKLSASKGLLILKVVFSPKTTMEEFRKCIEIAKSFYKKNKDLSLVFQPLTSNKKIKLNRKQLDIIYGIMKNSEFEVRLIPQIHKILKIVK
ncbi:MAG: 7-carboxy-7-deazaguanine synthase QueE [Brevinematia bacterium]